MPTCAFALAACNPSIDGNETPTSSTTTAAAQSSRDAVMGTSGASFEPPSSIAIATFDETRAVQGPDCAIDVSHAREGYAAARGTSSARLKLQVSCNGASYNYDLPADGSPIIVPLNMGDGSYALRVMQNTSGSNYVEILSTSTDVALESEFAPFLRPNVFCSFADDSICVRKARELTSGCATQADAVQAICEYVAHNVSYDKAKAERLSSATGYVPNPDVTLTSMSGICFDYASLGAAMLRSVGIPARIVTGYVSPDDFYHAWIMVYIDGAWHSAEFSIEPGQWSRVDLTFAAAGSGTSFVGDGISYQDRYVY